MFNIAGLGSGALLSDQSQPEQPDSSNSRYSGGGLFGNQAATPRSQISGPMGGFFGLGQAIVGNIFNAMEHMAAPYHHYGETNRYSKDQKIELSDGPSIERPAEFATLHYPRHKYAPLYNKAQDEETKPIRLLELLPPHPQHPDLVFCKLRTYSLEQAPAYEAISYAWGVENTQDYPIIIVGELNDSVVPVTRHLYAALGRLRYPNYSRLLWADQICINQIDKAEKSKQVKQMGDIYTKSTQTVIWLGEEDMSDRQYISEIFDALKRTPHNTEKQDQQMLKSLVEIQNPGRWDPFPTATPGQQRREAITRLLNRTWFSRVWVFQEAVVSPKVTVTLGTQTLALQDLFRLVRVVFELEDTAGGYTHSIAKRTRGFDTLYLIQHNRHGGCGDPNCPRNKVTSNFLGLVMQALQQLESTKELDLIYAFAGFQSPRIIDIDYQLPTRIAWINATKSIIQNSRSLDVFAAVRGDAPCEMDLPSWVPNFSNLYPYARPIAAPDFNTSFNASAGIPHTWVDPQDAYVLTAKGHILGRIMYVSPVNMDTKSNRSEPLGTKGVLAYKHHQEYVAKAVAMNGASPISLGQIVRTLLADGAFGHEQPLCHPIEDIIRVCDTEDTIQASYDAGMPVREYGILTKLREWGLIVQQKRIFLSDKLELGLAPKIVKEGDLICLLHGSKVPCLLRRAERNTYKIVCQCYVDGRMYYNGSYEDKAQLETAAREFLIA